ncbi:hypothetical protein E5F05_10605 [Deinococcus metallilatus]|uniref:Zn finger protein n=1 Tax=Deinococcus metallilatus TaxID=1211322 RepID=A0AAJ5JXW2_9DEIO|nr:hypothetical protein [Deinococcus metallilatus]MBB5296635.1 putative Zn finger protein [Deinococcus metallilatus]QBY08348.1 hypothetical protein E5F05_10605 [Deinococcus metallilatus]RXJ11147.1 hypothetical protein ERJ73_09425 [Deinococcus metallilatus]TLK24638.1 hypothetical protein FCS05_13860 [Deinococcus metallilatus]GMA17554.1 hypothetical protein GCM10025871_38850 [Deinococcus metallilatus]
MRSPSREWLLALKEVSPDWPGERAEIVKRLWKRPDETDLLLDLLLREGLTEEALRLVGERERNIPNRQLLALSEQLDPARAVPLILRAAQRHIDRRTRGSYHEAAQVLARLPALIGKQATDWEICAVVERQPRLPALRDELRQAGLL